MKAEAQERDVGELVEHDEETKAQKTKRRNTIQQGGAHFEQMLYLRNKGLYTWERELHLMQSGHDDFGITSNRLLFAGKCQRLGANGLVASPHDMNSLYYLPLQLVTVMCKKLDIIQTRFAFAALPTVRRMSRSIINNSAVVFSCRSIEARASLPIINVFAE